MLAPILAFTADEAWEFVPGEAGRSVHETNWKPAPFLRSEAEQRLWQALFAVREQVLPVLEQARQARQIGKALEAQMTIEGLAPEIAAAPDHAEALRELINVSALSLKAAEAAPAGPALVFAAAKAPGQKCERCWHWETEVGRHADHPTLCGRCVSAIKA